MTTARDVLDALERDDGLEAVAAAERLLDRDDLEGEVWECLLEALAERGSEAALCALEVHLARGHEGSIADLCSAARHLAHTPAFRSRIVAAVQGAALALPARRKAWRRESRVALAELVAELVPDQKARRAALEALPEEEMARPSPWDQRGPEVRRRLFMALEPEAAVELALDAAMKASPEDPLGWRAALEPLAARPDTGPLIKVGLEGVMAANRFGFPLDLGPAVVLSGADCTALFSEDPFVGLRRRWKKTSALMEELIEEGAVDDPDALRAEVRVGMGSLELIQRAGLGVSFDAEAGVLPVPYARLLQWLAALSPFDWTVSDTPTANGEIEYRIEVRDGEATARTELVDRSDYFDVTAVLDVLNDLRAAAGDSRRYASIETGDQTAFVLLDEPAALDARLRRFGLRKLAARRRR